MTRLWPGLLGVTQVVQPETILRWHRAGFKTFWRWLPPAKLGHVCKPVDFANGSHFAGGVIRPTLYTDCGLSTVPGME